VRPPPGSGRQAGFPEAALARARNGGPYRATEVRYVPDNILREHFRIAGRSYWISDGLRQTVGFERHDLLSDRFETGFDLIVCRNVTIYFTEQARNRLNDQFHESLAVGGVLFIGATESIFNAPEIGLARVDHGFYVKASNGAAGAIKAGGRGIAAEDSRGRRNAADICAVC